MGMKNSTVPEKRIFRFLGRSYDLDMGYLPKATHSILWISLIFTASYGTDLEFSQ
jgi:hypothetical protein